MEPIISGDGECAEWQTKDSRGVVMLVCLAVTISVHLYSYEERHPSFGPINVADSQPQVLSCSGDIFVGTFDIV